jgi:hypothetical protein
MASQYEDRQHKYITYGRRPTRHTIMDTQSDRPCWPRVTGESASNRIEGWLRSAVRRNEAEVVLTRVAQTVDDHCVDVRRVTQRLIDVQDEEPLILPSDTRVCALVRRR